MKDIKTALAESIDYIFALVAAYGGKVLLALLALIVGLWFIRRIVNFTNQYSTKTVPDKTLATFLSNLVSILLKVLLVLSIASILGIETTSFVAVIGAASLAVGLALQGRLSNFAGVVMILIFRPFKIGDYIGSQGLEGEVIDIGIFVTKLETFDKRILILPNGPLANGNLTNYTASEIRAVEISIGISYSDNIAAGKEAMEAVLKEDPRILQDEANVVAVVDLGSSSVDFLVRAFVKTDDYWAFFFDARPALKTAVENAGLTIPFPQRDVHIYQEESAS